LRDGVFRFREPRFCLPSAFLVRLQALRQLDLRRREGRPAFTDARNGIGQTRACGCQFGLRRVILGVIRCPRRLKRGTLRFKDGFLRIERRLLLRVIRVCRVQGRVSLPQGLKGRIEGFLLLREHGLGLRKAFLRGLFFFREKRQVFIVGFLGDRKLARLRCYGRASRIELRLRVIELRLGRCPLPLEFGARVIDLCLRLLLRFKVTDLGPFR